MTTTYEIHLNAKGPSGEIRIIPMTRGLFRATTETIADVRKTVLKVCTSYVNEAVTLDIGELTAKIYEVTFTGERVYIADMFTYKA